MDVGERCRVAEHFDIEGSDEVLFEVFRGDAFFGHAWLERLKFIDNDFVLLLFGLGLADALNKLFELFGQMTGG